MAPPPSPKIYTVLDDKESQSDQLNDLFGKCGAAEGMLQLIGGLLSNAEKLQRKLQSDQKPSQEKPLTRRVALGSDPIKEKFHMLLKQQPELKNWLNRLKSPKNLTNPHPPPPGIHLYTPKPPSGPPSLLNMRETAFRGMVQNLLHSNRPVEFTQISPIQEETPPSIF